MNTSANETSLYPGVSVQDAKIVTALIVDVALGSLLLTAFLLLRRRVPEMFEARCTDEVAPSRPGKGIIGWIVSAIQYDNELWLLKCAGPCACSCVSSRWQRAGFAPHCRGSSH